MKILITGGAGFVGSHTADKLIEKGHEVRILDNLEEQVHNNKIPEYLNKKCEFVQGDVRDREVFKKVLEDVDVVYNFAARVGVGQSMYDISEYVSTNCVGTANLFDIIVKENLKIKKIILASSMSIYGEGAYFCGNCFEKFYPKKREINEENFDFSCTKCYSDNVKPIEVNEDKPMFPASIYAISKKDQEDYSLLLGNTYNISVIAYRYWNIYGTRQALSNPYTGVCAIFSSCLLNDNKPTIYEDGNQLRDFVHIDDIVQANILALDSRISGSFNIGSGYSLSISKVAEILAKKMEKIIVPEISMKYRVGDVRHCIPNINKARTMLKYYPKYDLESGINDLIEWVKTQESVDDTRNMNKKLDNLGILK